MLVAERSFPGARGFDSLPWSNEGTLAQAMKMAERGEFFVGYLGAINKTRLGYLQQAKLGFMPVTFGRASFDPNVAVRQCLALEIPTPVTVWRDFEDYRQGKEQALKDLAKWARGIRNAGYEAGLYYAPPQPLTGPEMYSLPFTQYWSSAGRLVSDSAVGGDGSVWDEPYPAGLSMRQLWHNNSKTGGQWWPPGPPKPDSVWVDVNSIQFDRKGRLPTWCR